MISLITAALLSYLIGSIPTAYIFGRVLKGIDIRDYGSGNVGATNALRVLGKWPGITVLLIDIIKGLVCVFFLGDIFIGKINFLPDEIVRIILGISSVSGHIWTVFLKFKGGKGMATMLGVLIGLAFKIPGLNIVLVLSILVWISVFLSARIVSVASIISAFSLPVFMIIFKQSVTLKILSFIFCTLAIVLHRSNIKRILEGKERRISFKKSA